jgi:hypothetical protein
MASASRGQGGGGGQPSAVGIATVGQDKLLIAQVDTVQVGVVTAANTDVKIVVQGQDKQGQTVEWCACNKFTCGIL